uniref:NR LBD domain-containing protein n=2 Tax=Mesocestoides corti TaxID=53468 RepID=A0A5K3EM06_MESCO
MGDNEGSQKTSVSPTAANTSQTGQESFQRKRLRPIKPRIRPSSTPAQSLTQQNMPLITQPPAAMQTKQLRAVNQSSENTETLHLVAGPKATPILTSTAMQQSKTAAHTRNRKRLIRFPKRCALPSPDISPDGGSLLTELLRTIESSFCVTFRDHLVYPAFKRSQEQIHAANEATLQHLFGVVKWEDGRPHTAQAFEVRHKSFQAFQTCFDRIMQDAVKFAKRIPGFSDLLPEDRMVLVQSGCFELACVIFSFYVDEESQTFCGPGNFTLSQSQMWLTFPMSKKFVNLLFDFAFQVQSYRLEPLKLGLLLAVLLVTPDREGLTNHEEVTWLRDLICQAFRFQLMVTNSNGVSLFNHLVSSTKEELHRLASEHRRQLINMRAAGFTFQNDLYSETFNLV